MSERATPRQELLSTVTLAFATILTSWTSFQAAKWSGRQAIAFADAARAQTLATQKDTAALTRLSFDAGLFVTWVSAVASEQLQRSSDEPWEPDPEKLSGFLYARFPPSLRGGVDAWLATFPLHKEGGPATPFEMSEYVRPEVAEAAVLHAEADEAAARGRESNLRSDRYVATSVLIAAVLFFSAVGSKLEQPLLRKVTLTMSVVFLSIAGAVVASFPVALG